MVKIRIEGIPHEVNKTIDHLKKYMAVYGQSETYPNRNSEQIRVYLEVNPNAEELYVYPQGDSLTGGCVGFNFPSESSVHHELATLSDIKRYWGFTNMEGTILHLKEGCYIVQNEKAKKFKVQELVGNEV